MRYLNRIIFINSANIRYAEINLKGNVHFIGTQGVGKSTLLRAILFFYNADTLGLGIPRQKSSYVDYYFKNDNAYIIYEVVREDGKFCVLSYKSKHKVCFRFFDGAYRQDLLVNEDGKVAERWEDIATILDLNGIYYTKRRIEEYKAYRDIIYGNIEVKRSENRRYSILESREYQNIPKTIQNVFLNSKMEADFIKQTIIMSLDNDVRIELDKYAHHLNGFESQLLDIKRFKTPKSIAQAEEISNLYVAINALEREKIQLAKELAYAVKKSEEALPILEEKLQTKSEKSQVLEQKVQVLNKNYREREVNFSGEIKLENKNITHARSLVKKYDEIDISSIIKRVDTKNDLESRQFDLRQEQQLLLSKFASIDEKYKQLVAKLNNQLLAFKAAKQSDITKLKDAFYEFKDLNNKQYNQFVTDIRIDAENELATLNEVWEQKKQALGVLKIKEVEIKHHRFFEEEIDSTQLKINEGKNENRSLQAAIDSANAEVVNLQKQWYLELNKLENSTENEKGKLADKIKKLEEKHSEIDIYLENSKSSLYGWLTENYPNWSQTIGKVIDEKSVLFNNDLSPKHSSDKGNLFGVEIDLSQIDKQVKTVKEYEVEKEHLAFEITEAKEALTALDKQFEKQTENLTKRFQPKIKAAKDSIRKNKYELEQMELKLKEYHVALSNYTNKAAEDKANALASVKAEIDKAIETQLTAKDKIDLAQQSLQKRINGKETERAKNLKKEKEQLDQSIEEINATIAEEGKSINDRIIKLEKEKAEELKAKGADTPRLKEIEKQLKSIETELNFIENNRNTVTEYYKDKREFIDNIEQYKAEKKKLENQLDNAKIRYHNQLEKLKNELTELNGIVANIKAKVKEIKDDLETWLDFTESELYETIAAHLLNPNSAFNTQKTLKQIIDSLRDIHYEKLNKRIESLKTTVAEFLGKFTEDNLFKFKKNLSDTASYLDFATMLRDFIEEQKIVRIEKEVNERFAWLVSTLTKQTNQLLTNSGSIQKVINKINKDFEEKNFAGVIKRIELKVDDSRHEIVQLLVLIKKFNDENAMDLGKANLFSSNDYEKQSKKAVDLLKQFVKKISELRKDYIALADSFELKFRIIENDNDSGWVEKLSNVGSEGTDVLVKAMLNIMLLNVFKEGASRRFKDFELHCMMDEIGKLHPNNVRGILNFAKDRNIHLISGSPIENDALAFDHIYKLSKDNKSITRVKRIISQYS